MLSFFMTHSLRMETEEQSVKIRTVCDCFKHRPRLQSTLCFAVRCVCICMGAPVLQGQHQHTKHSNGCALLRCVCTRHCTLQLRVCKKKMCRCSVCFSVSMVTSLEVPREREKSHKSAMWRLYQCARIREYTHTPCVCVCVLLCVTIQCAYFFFWRRRWQQR